MKRVGRILLGCSIAALAVWCALAAWFGPFASAVVAVAMGLSGMLALAALVSGRGLRVALAACIPLFAFLVAWSRVEPSNDRAWLPDVDRLPRAEIDGDRVTIRDIRDFDYRTDSDYTPHYYDKTFDLRELDEVDLISVYWMGDAIAHVMLSFGFAGRDHVAISIETRKEVGESYDTIRGFFRQYELFYVVGDERDLIRLRTNYRKDPVEDVYLYRTAIPIENARRLFLDYLREINSLHDRPEFYNTATTNCTTNVYRHTRVNPGSHAFSWKILLSGYAAEYVHERGMLDDSLPFDELKRRSRINDAALAADAAPDFSQRIRVGLPRPKPREALR